MSDLDKYTSIFATHDHAYEHAFDNLKFSCKFTTDNSYIGLFDERKLIAILHLVKNNEKWCLNYMESKVVGHGHIRYLFMIAMDYHERITIDKELTVKYFKELAALVCWRTIGRTEFIIQRVNYKHLVCNDVLKLEELILEKRPAIVVKEIKRSKNEKRQDKQRDNNREGRYFVSEHFGDGKWIGFINP